MLAMILSICIDAIVFGALVFLIIWLGMRHRQRQRRRSDPAGQIIKKNRRIFASSQNIYTDRPEQERLSVASPQGIGPLSPAHPRELPRLDAMDYGHIDPWEVSVDVEHAETFRRMEEQFFDQNLQSTNELP